MSIVGVVTRVRGKCGQRRQVWGGGGRRKEASEEVRRVVGVMVIFRRWEGEKVVVVVVVVVWEERGRRDRPFPLLFIYWFLKYLHVPYTLTVTVTVVRATLVQSLQCSGWR